MRIIVLSILLGICMRRGKAVKGAEKATTKDQVDSCSVYSSNEGSCKSATYGALNDPCEWCEDKEIDGTVVDAGCFDFTDAPIGWDCSGVWRGKAVKGADNGEILFQLRGIPDTWEGNPFGMIQPRDSPTHVEPLEFNGVASNMSSSVVFSDTTASYGKIAVPLSKFEGWKFDIYVAHANGLWPCVDANGNGISNLELPHYTSEKSYLVEAAYVPNSKGEYFFNSSLTVV